MMKSLIAVAAVLAGTSMACADGEAARGDHYHGTSIWNSYYGGVNVGYGWAGNSASITGGDACVAAGLGACSPGNLSFESTGVLFGGQLGRNFRSGNIVYGVELDVSYAHLNGVQTVTLQPPPFFFAATTVERTVNWLSTLRARAGMLVSPSTLFYGTAGFAFGESTMAFSTNGSLAIGGFGSCGSVCGDKTDTRLATGWTVGAGVEHAFSNWVTLRGEYLYVDLGKQSLTMTTNSFLLPSGRLTADTQLTDNLVRSSLNFKF
jgi:outer membrane immunogenic protein